MSDATRYCDDCIWLKGERCTHSSSAKNSGASLVHRGVEPEYFLASIQRGSSLEGDCGREAKHFEAKEPAPVVVQEGELP